MDNKYQTLFNSLAFEKQFRPAFHLEWEDIDDCASELLSGMMERDIQVESKRSDYYYWSLDVYNTPLTEKEMEILNNAVGANEYDIEIQSDDDFPVTELSQGVAHKLLSKLAPFDVTASFADDEGIWLVGDETDAGVLNQCDKSAKNQ